MKILLITARYHPHRGGLESVVYHLSREFVRRGHIVEIVTNRYPSSLPVIEIIDGIKVTRMHFLLPGTIFLKSYRFDLYMAGLCYRFFTARVLRKLIQEFHPDVVNNHYLNETAEFAGCVLYESFRSIPWVISLHGGDVDGEPLIDKSCLDRFRTATRQAEKLTACSNFLAKQAGDLEPAVLEKMKVIHNGVDTAVFPMAKKKTSSAPYILAVGRLVSFKGFDVLIDAFAMLSQKYPEVNLVIAGEGELRSDLEERIKVHGLEQRVLLPGKVDSGQVSGLMAGSLFVAMPSQREPFGIVALEGMATGKCVLATPVGGIPEFLPCPPNQMILPDVSAWAQALDAWLVKANLGQLDGTMNRIEAQKRSWKFVAEQYLKVYQEVLV